MDAILNVVVGVVDFFQKIDPSYYALAGVLLAMSGAQEVFKKGFNNDARKLSDGANIAVTAALSGLVVAGDTFFSAAQQNPSMLGVKEAAALGAMTVIYRVLVKPVSSYISGVLSDAREFRGQQTAPDPAVVTPAATETTEPATEQAIG